MLIVSVLAVTALVNWADKTEPVWVARTSLSEGTILTKKHVKKESGRIREAGSQY
ncbi:MAG: hypothetical protein HOQ05_12685 [Corynebacteriales bacterium]|nr:hypothetical protein [Mycobacteriales bacterium]